MTTQLTTPEDDLAPFCCSACGEQRIDYLVLMDSRDLIAGTENHDPNSVSCSTCGAIEFIGEPFWREGAPERPPVVHLSVLQPVEALRTLLSSAA